MNINRNNQANPYWKRVLIVALIVSLLGNIALFWQLKQEQTIFDQKASEIAQNASEEVKKNSSKAAEETNKLKENIQEKDKEIAQLKNQNGLKAEEELTAEQQQLAEDFAKVAIDKSKSSQEMTESLKGIATQEVINKLIPSDTDHQQDDYGNYSFTLGDVTSYAQTKTEEGNRTFVVFVDYTINNPQFKDIKPQTIKGGLTVSESQVDGQWQVTDFSYFTR
ncbi:hypothetical protein [Enterococcus mundtii]|uniref:hypothetical protein n=1 Tax=Enterococcus mundtii TaxID=53346 RepID=UPI0032E04D57